MTALENTAETTVLKKRLSLWEKPPAECHQGDPLILAWRNRL